jgi:hypothetical protein
MAKSFVYNTGSSEDDIKKDELRLTFGIFIDGTLNNKENTKLRRKYRSEDEHSTITKDKKERDLKKEEADYKILEKGGSVSPPVGFDAQEYKDYLIGIHRTDIDYQGTDNSYSNDDTNVTRMWSCCNEEYKIYVEGMGTADKEYDNQDGFAFGSGRTGIRARVRLACERITEKIQSIKDIEENKKKKVTQITLDVFGFSRGAASARNFVHEVNAKKAYPAESIKIPDGFHQYYFRGEPRSVQKYRKALGDFDQLEIDPSLLIDGNLPPFGHLGYSLLKDTDITIEELEGIQIIIRFIGVYDTVSSYYEIGALGAYDSEGKLEDDSKYSKLAKEAWATHFKNDEGELGLHELGESNKFQKMVHFTAQDEHRRNFALTRINQIPGKAIEKNFPGVHCDIGGAYENEAEEYIDEIGTNISDDKYITREILSDITSPLLKNVLPSVGLAALKQDLIDQYWYKEKELDIKLQLGWIPPITSFRKLSGIRKYIKKEYSYIPLHFMEEFCRQTSMTDFMLDKTEAKFPLNDSFLEKVKTDLHKYAFEDGSEWKFKSDAQLLKEKQEQEEKIKQEEMVKVIMSGKLLEDDAKIKGDNLDPSIYKPKILIPEQEENKETKPIELDEVVVHGFGSQNALRKLRHEYLHWSSNRDWFGMEPNNDRKRVYYPKS